MLQIHYNTINVPLRLAEEICLFMERYSPSADLKTNMARCGSPEQLQQAINTGKLGVAILTRQHGILLLHTNTKIPGKHASDAENLLEDPLYVFTEIVACVVFPDYTEGMPASTLITMAVTHHLTVSDHHMYLRFHMFFVDYMRYNFRKHTYPVISHGMPGDQQHYHLQYLNWVRSVLKYSPSNIRASKNDNTLISVTPDAVDVEWLRHGIRQSIEVKLTQREILIGDENKLPTATSDNFYPITRNGTVIGYMHAEFEYDPDDDERIGWVRMIAWNPHGPYANRNMNKTMMNELRIAIRTWMRHMNIDTLLFIAYVSHLDTLGTNMPTYIDPIMQVLDVEYINGYNLF